MKEKKERIVRLIILGLLLFDLLEGGVLISNWIGGLRI